MEYSTYEVSYEVELDNGWMGQKKSEYCSNSKKHTK